MKKLVVSFLFFCIAIVSMTISAETWDRWTVKSVENNYVYVLGSYGRYENGEMVTSNYNDTEWIAFNPADGLLYWFGTLDGDFVYTYKVSGSMLYIYNMDDALVNKIEITTSLSNENGQGIFTVDKYGIYRVFILQSVE